MTFSLDTEIIFGVGVSAEYQHYLTIVYQNDVWTPAYSYEFHIIIFCFKVNLSFRKLIDASDCPEEIARVIPPPVQSQHSRNGAIDSHPRRNGRDAKK